MTFPKIHSGKCTINYEIISSTEGEETLYQCKECKKTFSKVRTFQTHYIIKHKENNFKCEKCCKLFAFKSMLKTHVAKCDGKLKSRILFRRKHESLEKECEIIEKEGIKLFQCNQCKKSFGKKATFQMHYYKVHKEKTFKCNTCEQAFSIPSLLKEHEKKCNIKDSAKVNQNYKEFIDWDARKKYQCEICTKCFETVIDFQAHSNLDHNNILKSMPCKEELDISSTANVTSLHNEFTANSKINEVKTENISESVKSEFVKQERDPLQIEYTENTDNALEHQLI